MKWAQLSYPTCDEIRLLGRESAQIPSRRNFSNIPQSDVVPKGGVTDDLIAERSVPKKQNVGRVVAGGARYIASEIEKYREYAAVLRPQIVRPRPEPRCRGPPRTIVPPSAHVPSLLLRKYTIALSVMASALPCEVDGVSWLHGHLRAGAKVLAEGANAALLDIDFGPRAGAPGGAVDEGVARSSMVPVFKRKKLH